MQKYPHFTWKTSNLPTNIESAGTSHPIQNKDYQHKPEALVLYRRNTKHRRPEGEED